MTIQDDSNSLPPSTRRAFLRRAGLASFVAGAAPAAASMIMGNTAQAAPLTDIDVDVLTFALNLEYLEAEFYSYAAFGEPLSARAAVNGTGASAPTIIKANPQVKFGNPIVASYAQEMAVLQNLGRSLVECPDDLGCDDCFSLQVAALCS